MDGHRLLGHSPLPFLAQVCSLWVKKLCDFNLEESGGSLLVSLSSLFIRMPRDIVRLVRRVQSFGFILSRSFTLFGIFMVFWIWSLDLRFMVFAHTSIWDLYH